MSNSKDLINLQTLMSSKEMDDIIKSEVDEIVESEINKRVNEFCLHLSANGLGPEMVKVAANAYIDEDSGEVVVECTAFDRKTGLPLDDKGEIMETPLKMKSMWENEEFMEWFNNQPEHIQKMVKKYPPDKFYKLASSPMPVKLQSYDESEDGEMTLKVVVLDHVRGPRGLSGIKPKDLLDYKLN